MWWYIAVFIVALLFVISYRPKPQNTPPAGLNDVNVPTAEEGREIPVLFGTRVIGGANVCWYGLFRAEAVRKSGGKK